MRLYGINLVTVENVSIVSDSSAKVVILIDDNIREYIRKDAIAGIGSEGLKGNKLFIISPGTGGKSVIENNDIIATIQSTDIDDILRPLKMTIDNTAFITDDLAKLSANIESGKGAIGRLLMKTTPADNFDSTMENLKEGTAALKQLLEKVQGSWMLGFNDK